MANDSESVTVPVEMLQKLSAMAEQAGIELPGVTRFAPTIDVTIPLRMLALDLGRHLAQRNIFLKGHSIVTVDDTTGDEEPMTAARFVGWCEEFVAFKSSGRSQRLRDSLTREDATLILEQDVFRKCLRPLDAIHTMRLPVQRAAAGKIEFLEPGYDAESRIYTVDVLKYPMDWSIEQARDFIDQHGEDMPLSWPDGNEERRPVCMNRSWSVVVTAMLGVYCKAMFPPGTPRPMIAGIGNQPGTGKSLLVMMMLMPVFGHAAVNKIPKDDETMAKELDTVAMNQRPYVFFDDIGSGMFSHPLNAFITAESRTGRELGGNRNFFALSQTQIFSTGNDIKISADLMRRALVFELFLASEVQGRSYKRPMSAKYLKAPATRANFLSAMCAIVRHGGAWLDMQGAEGYALPQVRPLATFDEWTETLARLMLLAGYTDPLATPELSVGGNEDDSEMRDLLVKVASETSEDMEFDRKQLVEKAREFGLLESLVGLTGDKDLDSTSMKKWGRQLQKWRGRELTDAHGRKFRFSHKRQKRGAKYPLTFLKPKTS